ncbi:hypothetical protein ZIOFF_037043 [Zingiber officinale]|uniref:UBC core domain-containing protein n=1 Tax=Zingiber officinale TaxID=94328 RepID=A0A8J5GRF4_ZINOF|nr:hypothetical protein ZIOFF_037043 [Zingiber officinale]
MNAIPLDSIKVRLLLLTCPLPSALIPRLLFFRSIRERSLERAAGDPIRVVSMANSNLPRRIIKVCPFLVLLFFPFLLSPIRHDQVQEIGEIAPEETQRLLSEPAPGISASPSEDNMRYFNVMILGPTQSPYEGGVFKLELFLPEEYPMAAPKVRYSVVNLLRISIRRQNL